MDAQRSKNVARLVLASGSAYRKALLLRLTDRFSVQQPDIDETPHPDEKVASLVERLARQKARCVGSGLSDALVIGSDQCAAIDGTMLNKPGNFDNALQQLMMCSGREVIFHTGLCLLDTRDQSEQFEDVLTRVVFRQYTAQQAKNYLHIDKPWDCCGSIRSEGRGIALCSRIESDDPSTLLGLPLIALSQMLENVGFELL